MTRPDELLSWIGLVAAGVAGLLYLAGKTRRLFVAVERMSHLVSGELTSDREAATESSVKDDVHAIAVAVGRLEGAFDEVAGRVSALEAMTLLDWQTLQEPLHRKGTQ